MLGCGAKCPKSVPMREVPPGNPLHPKPLHGASSIQWSEESGVGSADASVLCMGGVQV